MLCCPSTQQKKVIIDDGETKSDCNPVEKIVIARKNDQDHQKCLQHKHSHKVKETTTRLPLQWRAVKKYSTRYKGSWKLPDKGKKKFSDYE